MPAKIVAMKRQALSGQKSVRESKRDYTNFNVYIHFLLKCQNLVFDIKLQKISDIKGFSCMSSYFQCLCRTHFDYTVYARKAKLPCDQVSRILTLLGMENADPDPFSNCMLI